MTDSRLSIVSIGRNALAGLICFLSFLVFLFQAVAGGALYSSMSTSFLPSLFTWVVPLMGGDAAVRQWHHTGMRVQGLRLPPGVSCLDGGTGEFGLLVLMRQARHVVLVDGTVDGAPVGTVHRLQPRFSKDYPRTLTAHDIGLKDLLDAFYLLGNSPQVTLFALSIAPFQDMRFGLSAELAARVPEIAGQIHATICSLVAGEAA